MAALLQRRFPNLTDAERAQAIERGEVRVQGTVANNPRTLLPAEAVITIEPRHPALRGEAKLRAALTAFELDLTRRTAMDVGAAAGGFTRVLLEAGCRRVYAIDAGHGQLAGWLRQHPNVMDLENHNLGDLDPTVVPEPIDVITIDVSYLSLAAAAPQLNQISIAAAADLIALVKPQFELNRATLPHARADLDAALAQASRAFEQNGWTVQAAIDSPVLGSRGAKELLLHAKRR